MRRTSLVLLVLLGLGLFGCHRHHRRDVVTGARLSIAGARYRALLGVASRDTRCGAGQLGVSEPSPGIFSVQGCGLVREYVLACRGRHRCQWSPVVPVEQVAAQETGCAQGPVQLALSGPLSRHVSLCGQELDYALACGPAGCGWSRGGAPAMLMQSPTEGAVIVVADDGSVPQPPAAEASGEVVDLGAAGTLQSLLATQIAAIRQCTGGQPVTLTLRWSAQGVVSLGLGAPYAGTAVEACVQQAVGPVAIQAPGAEGSISATL